MRFPNTKPRHFSTGSNCVMFHVCKKHTERCSTGWNNSSFNVNTTQQVIGPMSKHQQLILTILFRPHTAYCDTSPTSSYNLELLYLFWSRRTRYSSWINRFVPFSKLQLQKIMWNSMTFKWNWEHNLHEDLTKIDFVHLNVMLSNSVELLFQWWRLRTDNC